MAFVLVLGIIFLLFTSALGLKKFQLYCALTTLAYAVLSIEIITRINGLTLIFLTVTILLSLPYLKLKLYDIIGCAAIALPCIFWLSTQEFVDGFAYSHIFVASGVALASNLLFDRQKRRTLCALALLSSMIICRSYGVYLNAIDVVTATLIAVILTENYKIKQVSSAESSRIFARARAR